jgi:enoyl-CoA hydratase/carnithine racemase
METMIVEHAGGVATVTLDRPERKNAINLEMWNELAAVGRDLASSDEVRCVVLTGSGGAFCSGADLSGSAEDRHQLARMREVNRVVTTWHDLPQPTIAKVTGIAAGAGMSLALGCDLVVASEQARFSQIFARRGLSLDAGSSWLLPRLIGLHRAKELALFGDIVSAEEARELGLVNRLVPADEIDAFVAGWAERLAAGPPIALAMTKRMLNRSFESSFEQVLDEEGVAQTVNFGTTDTVEAITAFLQKREPRFRGR